MTLTFVTVGTGAVSGEADLDFIKLQGDALKAD